MNFNVLSERDSHITQIAALDEDSDEYFCTYVIPQKPISTQASKVTGLALNGTTLHHNGKAVKAVSIQEALQDLISFLGNLASKKPKILVGHNIKSYDCPILMNALRNCNIEDRFEEEVIGFLDTMKLFRLSFPSQKSYSQQHLSKVLLAEDFTYEAHNALEDVKTLKKIVNLPSVSSINKPSCEFSVDYVTKSIDYNSVVKRNMPSLQVLVNRKIITAGMARKIAGSDLSLRHLQLVHKRIGRDGLSALLSETVAGRVRVSKSQKVISSLCDYF